MPRFSANLSTLFQEWAPHDRFVAAAQAGFQGVEVPFPYDIGMGRLGDLLSMNGLELSCFNAPAGDWEAGERGLAALPGREEEFFDGLEQALDLADFVDAKRIHVMAGIIPENEDFDTVYDTFIGNLIRATKEARQRGVSLMVEAISPASIPDYMLASPDQALAVMADVEDPGLQLMFDVYHAQMVQGRLAETLESAMAVLGNVQIAGVPDRHEPNSGEVNYTYLFDLLDAHGYGGWVGLEYTPWMGTLPGLRWAKPWGISGDTVQIAPERVEPKRGKR